MEDEEKLDRTGAYDWERLLDKDVEPPPEEFSNPSGVGGDRCDVPLDAEKDPDCDHEITAHVDDMVLEESKPGYGIPGFEGEEAGGG